MKYISSDTNVWIDFLTINRLDWPFKLPYTYLMDEDAIDDEFLNPPSVGVRLVELGLIKTSLSDEEFLLAEEFNAKFLKLSRYDCIALAIAKVRKIELLTGDRALRAAAVVEGVNVIGTIGILDRLIEGKYITQDELDHCICDLIKHNGNEVRLPNEELLKRVSYMK